MNEEEIRKALEIIKEPITVNCIEYKYFDQENYDKITRVYDNCLWLVNNLEQINLILAQENKQLKSQLEQRDNIINKVREFVCDYKKQWTLNDDVVDDMNELLEILNIDKGE